MFKRYNNQFEALLTALTKRIDEGSDVELWPLKLKVQTQSPQQQLEKIKEDIAHVDVEIPPVGYVEQPEIIAAAPADNAAQQPIDYSKKLEAELDVSIAYAAEDLVLRELQDEFSAPINRQVKLGPDLFDGLFIKSGIPHVIEVKIAKNFFEDRRLREYLKKMSNGLLAQEYGQNAKILFVVVYRDKSANLIEEKKKLSAVATVAFENRVFSENRVRCPASG